MIQLNSHIELAYLQTILPITTTSPVLKQQHQQAQRELLRRKKSDKNQTTVKATQYVMRRGATDFALSAAIFCSSTSGVQKLEIFSYAKKFGLGMLTILAAAKNFDISHRN